MDRPAVLEEILEHSRSLGFLGPGQIDSHVLHARGLAQVAEAHFDRFGAGIPELVIDLGTGGGVPGLVWAWMWPSTRFLLLDANHRRTAFLDETVAALGWTERVRVLCERAEVAGRDSAIRQSADMVVARSFGRPAVTAECAAPLVKVDGLLVVAEPPPSQSDSNGSVPRWPAAAVAELGLVPLTPVIEPVSAQVLVQRSACPDRYPRRTGVPARRPLF